ncbi:MAG: sulfatase-like hydrolase/transferase, partial [Salinigranum sp.]
HSAGFTRDRGKHSFGYLVNDVAKRWVNDFARDDDPYFLYVHYPDTHHPYYPPLPYQDLFADDLPMSGAEAAEVALEVSENLFDYIADGCALSDRQRAALEATYDAQIRYSDRLVGELLRHVRRRSDRDTWIVVTSDHGELLGERGLLAHRLVLDSRLTRVPMVVAGDVPGVSADAGPDSAARPGGEADLVQHADVMETLLSAVGADISQFQGVDLAEARREFAFAQRGGERADGLTRELAARNDAFDPSQFPAGDATSVTDGAFRYVAGDDGAALYRLPAETAVGLDHPAVDRLAPAHREFVDGKALPVTDERVKGELDAGMKRHLEDLGYM